MQSDSATGADAIATLVRARRTIHEFADGVPPRERVLAALDAARWAPNHHRTEPWRFTLLGPRKITRDPRFFAAIDVDPARESVVGLLWYGYPADIPQQARRPLADVMREVD